MISYELRIQLVEEHLLLSEAEIGAAEEQIAQDDADGQDAAEKIAVEKLLGSASILDRLKRNKSLNTKSNTKIAEEVSRLKTEWHTRRHLLLSTALPSEKGFRGAALVPDWTKFSTRAGPPIGPPPAAAPSRQTEPAWACRRPPRATMPSCRLPRPSLALAPPSPAELLDQGRLSKHASRTGSCTQKLWPSSPWRSGGWAGCSANVGANGRTGRIDCILATPAAVQPVLPSAPPGLPSPGMSPPTAIVGTERTLSPSRARAD